VALLSVGGRDTTGVPRAQTRQPALLPRPYRRQRSAMCSFLSDEPPSAERSGWRHRSRVLHRREDQRAGRTRTPTAHSPSRCRSLPLAPHGSSPLVVARLAPATGRGPLVQQRRNRTAHQAHVPTRLLRPARPRTRHRASSQVEQSDPPRSLRASRALLMAMRIQATQRLVDIWMVTPGTYALVWIVTQDVAL
jgi:hypothetical protein